jgi:hypothetical protein
VISWQQFAAGLGLALGLAIAAVAQEACLRPIPPEEIEPPRDDPEFRGFLNQEYQAYLLGMQDYLNCLGREHESATKETSKIMAQWMLWFGHDAVIRDRRDGEASEEAN